MKCTGQTPGPCCPGNKTTRREKMKEREYRGKILKLGGEIKDPSHVVNFPDTFSINNKGEALDILDIIILAQTEDDLDYTVNIDTPLEALKAAIKKGIA
jgi:hypothetical protein